MNAIELIAKERQEQIEKHGWTIEHDAICNSHYQLSEAASHLLCLDFDDIRENFTAPTDWNEDALIKMLEKPYYDRLIIAGALIAAEIDRINSIT